MRNVTRRIAGWFARWPPLAILAAGWVVTVVYAFPGMMTMDSIDQLTEARNGFYTDGHPPAMAALWRIVDAIVAGPFGMLVLQTVAFLAGLYLLLCRAMRTRRAAFVASLLLVFPPILAPMAVIWKDCIMAGFLVLGTACLLAGCRWVRVLGLACLWLATAVRYNTPAATLPLVVLLFRWSDAAIETWKQWLARYAIALAAWLAITVLAFGIGSALTDRKMHVWHSSLALLDIAGTLAEVDGTIPDEQLRQTLAGTEILVDHDIHAAIRKVYIPWDFEPLIIREGHLWNMPIQGTTPAPAAKRDAIARAFWDVVLDHPGAYLTHRLATFREVLGLAPRNMNGTVMTHRNQFETLVAKLGIAIGSSHLQDFLQRKVKRIARSSPLFRPWFYLVLSLVLLPLCLRRDRDLTALVLSGLAMEASLFVFAPTPDYRYSHWLVICTCVAIAMLIARRARDHQKTTAESAR